jgi:serine/threonine protein kinase
MDEQNANDSSTGDDSATVPYAGQNQGPGLPPVPGSDDGPPIEQPPRELNAAPKPDDSVSRNADASHIPSHTDNRGTSVPQIREVSEWLRPFLRPSRRPDSLGMLDAYEVLGVVGRGSMGIVVKAFDNTLQRIVAIKIMAPHLLPSQNARERFFREARLAAGISHPNVVTIHAVGQTGDVPYLVMEYIDGQSLENRIRAGHLPLPDVLRISQQMAEGLAAAHRQGLVHRDIKPANVMLEDSIERVKIADFGLARVAMESSDLTSMGEVVGTPSYMSPEQVNGEAIDARSDLFSMGCVMYAMLTRRSPFQASNPLAAARKVASAEPPPLEELSVAPPTLCDLIRTLLSKKPDDRIQTGEELAEELRRQMVELNSPSHDPTVSLHPEKQASRPDPRLTYSAAAVGLLLLGGAFWGQSRWRENPAGSTAAALTGIGDGRQLIGPADQTGPRQLNVAQDGSAPYASIGDALAAASPGDTIHILDTGPYHEGLLLDDARRLRGVTILGNGAVIASASARSLIHIAGVPELSLRGLTINVAGHQHGLDIEGLCPGLSIHDCRFLALNPANAPMSLVYLHGGASGESDAPISFEKCTLRYGGVGVVLGEPHNTRPISHIAVRDCRFNGPSSISGIALILFDEMQHLEIVGNLIEKGETSLSLNLTHPESAKDVLFAWNTINGFESAMNLNESPPAQNISYHSNLLLNVSALPVTRENLSAIASWFKGNVWEHDPRGLELINAIADRRDYIPVARASPDDEDYLRPTDDTVHAGRHHWRDSRADSADEPSRP